VANRLNGESEFYRFAGNWLCGAGYAPRRSAALRPSLPACEFIRQKHSYTHRVPAQNLIFPLQMSALLESDRLRDFFGAVSKNLLEMEI